jgi:hypothetical protein
MTNSSLSPAAQAVLDAYDISSDGHYDDGVWVPHVGKQIAAALRAAADLLAAEVDAPRVDGSKYNGLWHSQDLLNAIAAELEAQ